MVNNVQVSLPGFIISVSVFILVVLFWLFYKNATHASSLLDKKLSLEHTVTCLGDLVAHVFKQCNSGGGGGGDPTTGVPDTSAGGVITRTSCPMLATLLDSLEGLRLLNDSKVYVFIIDATGNQVVNGGNRSIAHVNGTRPGENTLAYCDTDGNKAVQMLLDKASAGGGYVEYKWSDPHTQQYVKKLSYVRKIADTPWIIGAGLYL
jgi:hypothetical protein